MSQAKASSATSLEASAVAEPKRRYCTADQWREIVEAFHRSSFTRSAFCKQQGIATGGLYNWQRRFEQEILSTRDNESAFVEIQPPAGGTAANRQPWQEKTARKRTPINVTETRDFCIFLLKAQSKMEFS